VAWKSFHAANLKNIKAKFKMRAFFSHLVLLSAQGEVAGFGIKARKRSESRARAYGGERSLYSSTRRPALFYLAVLENVTLPKSRAKKLLSSHFNYTSA